MSNDRINTIYKILENRESVTVEELKDMLHISESSIRRALVLMEDQHMIERYYGGARISHDQIKETSLSVRNLYNHEIKKKLAAFAASLIKDGDVVYIDGGTTTTAIVDYISVNNILVVTQAINVFDKIINKNARCFIASGYLKKNTGLIIGSETIDVINKMNFSISFLGSNSVHQTNGYSAQEDMEATLKSAVIKRSKTVFVVADSSKFNKLTIPKFAELQDCNLITDQLVEHFNYREIPLVYYLSESGFKRY